VSTALTQCLFRHPVSLHLRPEWRFNCSIASDIELNGKGGRIANSSPRDACRSVLRFTMGLRFLPELCGVCWLNGLG